MERLLKVFLISCVLTAYTEMVESGTCGFGIPQWYNPRDKLCCAGQLYNKVSQDGISYACCKRPGYQPEPYDEYNQLCCGFQIVDKFDPTSGFERTCCKGQNETQFPGKVVEEGMTCCGGNVFDESKDGHMGCCGAVRFDRNDHMCCEDYKEVKLHPWSEDADCCGLEAYNYSTHWCYEEVSPPRITIRNIYYHRGVAYDTNKQVPCDDEEAFTLPRVCGSDQPKFYDVCKNVCCNGALYPLLARNGTRYGCCPRTDLDTQMLYDKDVYLCCGNQLVPLYDGAYKRECCKGDKEFYEIQEKGQTCCNGRVYYLKKNEDCCDTIPFNTEQFQCCRGDKLMEASLHRLTDSIKYQGCCGNNTFDEEKSWCDDRTDPPLVKSKHIAVCNGTDYDDRTHVCCHDEDGPLLKKPYVDPRYPIKFGCCNKRLINTQDEKCCSGNTEEGITEHAIYKHRICCGNESTDGHMDCCGAVMFDRNDHMCCRDYKEVKLHPWSEDADCCGLKAFNYSTHWCYEEVSPPRIIPRNIDYHRGVAYDTNKQVPCYDEEGTLLEIPKQDQRYPVYYKCCNKALINADLEKCCPANADRNSIEHPIRINHSCCGNSSVKSNSRREQCCNGVPNKISEEAAEENHRCCGPDFISVKYECCNGQRLEPESACCGGKHVYSKNSPTGCCGGLLYNTNDKVCCSLSFSISKTIKKKERDHTNCCIKTLKSFNIFNQSQAEQCVTGGHALKPCPYCDSSLSSTFCEKKYLYAIYVTEMEYKSMRTVITGYSSLKINLTVSFPYLCVGCIQKYEKYAIFTNRRLKREQLRLNGRDMIIKYDNENISKIKKSCEILRKITRTTHREMRKSQKKDTKVGRSHKKHRKARRKLSRRHRRRLA